MVMNFKSRIYCTKENHLNFKGKSINDNIFKCKQLIGCLQSENTTFIERIQIVSKTIKDGKKKRPYKIKSLEFLISRKIEEAEFVELIRIMKECGFSSTEKKISIQFIDIKNNPRKPLYDYDFITLESNEPKTYSNVNKYTYNVKYIDLFKSK